MKPPLCACARVCQVNCNAELTNLRQATVPAPTVAQMTTLQASESSSWKLKWSRKILAAQHNPTHNAIIWSRPAACLRPSTLHVAAVLCSDWMTFSFRARCASLERDRDELAETVARLTRGRKKKEGGGGLSVAAPGQRNGDLCHSKSSQCSVGAR